MLAVASMTVTVSAQNTVITSNKFGDNWYWGINVGAASTPGSDNGKAVKNTDFKAFAPNASLRIGKNLTTVFGLVAEGTAYGFANKKSFLDNKTGVEAINVSLLSSFNLSNLFGGYKGEPRTFELIGLGGFGWGHMFGGQNKVNMLTSKFAIDLAFNLGSSKATQFYIEPNIVYALKGWNVPAAYGVPDVKYNFNKAMLGVNIGLNYKFGNSNGTHNFAQAQLRNQSEIDDLNAQINSLRAESQAKDGRIANDGRTIADLQSKLTACQNQPKQVETNERVIIKENSQLPPMVVFGVNKSSIDASQYATIELIANYMRNHKDAKIAIKGFASSEGDKEKNQKLSEERANTVKQALIKRYKIAEDRLTAEGLGATDELSTEIAFNRVAMFYDTTIK